MNNKVSTEFEAHYFKVEMPKVRQRIVEMKEEMGDVGKCMKLRYLYDRLIELDAELIERKARYQASLQQDRPYPERALVASRIPQVEKEIKRIEAEIRLITEGHKGEITPAMIEVAKQYPMENLVEVKRGKALCPFHNDHNPSMGIKNNHFHCFACGVKGDPIDFVIKRDSVPFQEAVRWLS